MRNMIEDEFEVLYNLFPWLQAWSVLNIGL